jgi:CheY-like chemotaxis protein
LAQQAEAAGERFGLIITDRLEAPKDALWMMDQISRLPALKDTPFVLLSPKRLDVSEHAMRLVHQVAKPVRRAALSAAIRATQELGRSRGGLRLEDDAKHGTNAQSKEGGLKILVVEDNPLNSLMAVRFLEKHGHNVWAATSGEEALAFFNRQLFDAILMDIQMADIDGFEVTRRIRKAEGAQRHLPVIATTAHALDGDRERCLAAGMDDYLTKPLQLTELLAALARVTHEVTPQHPENMAAPPEHVEAK